MASLEMKQLKNRMLQMVEQGIMFKFDGKMDYSIVRKIRKSIEMTSSYMPTEPGVTFSSDNLNGVEVELLTPEKLWGEDIIIYIHGGGFINGNILTSRGFASQLAAESGLRVYTLSYRLAPENPFPAAPDDCLTVYKALLKKYPNARISLVGDSAGGTLSLVTTLRAKEEGILLPSSVVVYAPATDLTGKLEREKYADTDIVLSPDIEKVLKEFYCRDNDTSNPYISPLYGNYEGFPPLKIVVDSGEVLFLDSYLLCEKARKAGVEVDFQVWDDTFHGFPTAGKSTPESYQVLKDTVNFIKKHLK